MGSHHPLTPESDLSTVHSIDVPMVRETLSIIVFLIGNEWLALPTTVVKEVATCRPIHRIPHRRGKEIGGIVNLNGELTPYLALDRLLEIAPESSCEGVVWRHRQARMVAIVVTGGCWVFSVDEMEGIHHCDPASMKIIPVSSSHLLTGYLEGVFSIEGKQVGLLNVERLMMGFQI